MPKRQIVAVVGLPGSGKTEAIEYLIKKLNWPKIYFGDATFEELKNQGLPVNEKNERMVRESLREKHGMACYALWAIKKIKEIKSAQNILIESLYSWDEYLELKKAFKEEFAVVAIYASPKMRYARLGKRSVRPLTSEEAQSRDYSQIGNIAQAGPIAIADWTIINEGDRKDLFKKLNMLVKVLKK